MTYPKVPLMKAVHKRPRLLLAIFVPMLLGVAAGCHSQHPTPQTSSPANPAPAASPQRSEPGQQHLNPDVEKQRNEEKQQAQSTLDPEAVAAIHDTHKAIEDISSGDKQKALDAIEDATGKLNILLARNPSTALVPVDVEVAVIDTAPRDDKIVKRLVDGAEAAIALHDLPTARVLLYDLMSELRVRTFNLPLASYPDALKEAARLLDAGKNSDASDTLQTALNTLVVVDHVTPVPLILARAAVLAAQQERQSNKSGAQTLLETASNELRRCQELGYLASDAPEYKELNQEISNLRKQLNGSGDTNSLFSRLKSDIEGLLKKQSQKEHR
jgi:hypothetical protein